MPYTPNGRFVHVPPSDVTTKWACDFEKPWWQDEKFVVGQLSAAVRKVEIVNTLTEDSHVLEVAFFCSLWCQRLTFCRSAAKKRSMKFQTAIRHTTAMLGAIHGRS